MTLQEKIEIKKRDLERLAAYRRELMREPRLTYLFVELTERCNLECLHCGSACSRARGQTLEAELLLRTLGELAEDTGARKPMVCFTGGEPMLHPDFFRIAEQTVHLGFPWGMTTNGTLIDEAAAGRMKALGLGSVTVSLDGTETLHDWLRSTRGAFRRTLRGMACLKEAGIPVQVTTVIHKKNLPQLEALYSLLCGLGVPYWRVISLEPIGRALEHPELLLSREETLRLLDFIREKRYDAAAPMEVCYGCSHYLSFEYEREVRDNYFLCGAGILVGSILANGDVASCLDIARRPELVQGNIREDRFFDVWKTRFQALRRDRAALSPACRDCPERAFCEGDSTHTWDFDKQKPAFCILQRTGMTV